MSSPFSIRPGSDAEDFNEPNLIRIKADPNYLDRLNLIQTPILIPAELNSREKNAHFNQTTYKYVIIIYALGWGHENFGV